MADDNSRICVSICSTNQLTQKELLAKYDFCEIRTDLCKLTPNSLESLLKLNSNVIVTLRENKKSPQSNLNLIKCAIENDAKYIEIGIDSKIKKEALQLITNQLSRQKKKNNQLPKIILSYHNYHFTPTTDFLKTKIEECRSCGADIVKIVTFANSYEDCTRVLKLYNEFSIKAHNDSSKTKLIAFCMGEIGRFSRASSIFLGAPWGYAKADAKSLETAPGQYDYKRFRNLIFPLKKYPIPILHNIEKIGIDGSKSIAQRAILISGFTKNLSGEIANISDCSDNLRALELVKNLIPGKNLLRKGHKWYITDIQDNTKKESNKKYYNVGESGLLARCTLAYCSVNSKDYKIDGCGSILNRDFSESVKIIDNNGGSCSSSDNGGSYLPIKLTKGVDSKKIQIVADTTSQDVTGYLIALASKNEGGTIEVVNSVSDNYINLTVNVLKSFGFKIKSKVSGKKTIYNLFKNSKIDKTPYHISYNVESDWSSAANILVACAIKSYKNNGKTINLPLQLFAKNNSTNQPDMEIIKVLSLCGVKIETCNSKIRTLSANVLKGFKYNATTTPDLIPILVVLASFCNGETKIKGINRLINKESNRVDSILTEMHRAGVNICVKGDYFIIKGVKGSNRINEFQATSFSSHNDHRIAMAIIIYNQFSHDNKQQKMWIDNIECINKSFPSFLKHLYNK